MRVRIEQHPDELQPLSDSGSLAATHDRDKTEAGYTPSRYDSLWVSPKFAVGPVEHLWDYQRHLGLGGSDHAMVTSTLTRSVPPRDPGENIVAHLRRCRIIPDETPVVLNTSWLPAVDSERVESWITRDASGQARWTNRPGKELKWRDDAYTVNGLARKKFELAGVTFPNEPPVPTGGSASHTKTRPSCRSATAI